MSIFKKRIIAVFLVVIVSAAILAGFGLYGNIQMKKLPALSAKDVIDYTLENHDQGIITVGTIHDGRISYHVYGRNGEELPSKQYPYEIGSLTKTFTAAMICKAVQDGKIDLNSSIDKYLALPQKQHYPTVKQLLTHTSGYKGFYFEVPMISNFLSGRNDFYGISTATLYSRLSKVSIADEAHKFAYSNFGYATLGLILEKVYKSDYSTLLNSYINSLGLQNTHISDGTLPNAWDWMPEDAYLSAGALTSNAEDMLAYAAILLDLGICGGSCMDSLETINATPAQYEMIGIRMDQIGYGWIHDTQNDIIWHNGGTGDYNCYLGLDIKNRNAVIVLSNLPPSFKIPATVVGIKVLMEMK